jgi:hypothetical protein
LETRGQTAEEDPDPNECIKSLGQQSVTGSAMTAQSGLYQMPPKTTLAGTR